MSFKHNFKFHVIFIVLITLGFMINYIGIAIACLYLLYLKFQYECSDDKIRGILGIITSIIFVLNFIYTDSIWIVFYCMTIGVTLIEDAE